MSSLEPKTLPEIEKKVTKYEFVGCRVENHGRPLCGIQFCHYMKPNELIKFAVVSCNMISIYECVPQDIILIQRYTDPNPSEIFYNCCWSYDPKNFDLILCAAGFDGDIRIIYPIKMTASKSLSGHLDSINDLKLHPKYPSILLTASKDNTCRLWNIQTNVCIAIFGGKGGHSDPVVSVDFHSLGNRMVASGLDKLLLIWHIDKIKEQIEASFAVIGKIDEHLFCTLTQEYPDFSTQDVHHNVVDCVKWLNNLLLSKSMHNCIICWVPVYDQSNSFTEIDRFNLRDCDGWFTRFSMDVSMKYMAIGNPKGEIFLWSLQSAIPTEYIVLKHPKCVTAIRQTAFSKDGKVLISICADSIIWRWHIH